MKSKVLSSLVLLVGLCLTLGSCLDDDLTNAYQKLVEDVRAIDTYLVSNPPGPGDIIVRDASGVRLVITEQGTGVIPPTPENTIQVHYSGRILRNGALSVPFEQTTEGNPYTFTLTEKDAGGADVIVGWKHALYMMTEGTRATVYIPSGLAYGPEGSGSIPGNAILVFELELKTVNTEDQEPRLSQDKAKILTYIEENEIVNVQEDPSGLYYAIDRTGTGSTPGLYDHVYIRYTAKIMDVIGTVFDTNKEQGPDPFFSSRPVNYIHGLTIGLQKMQEGDKATFFIPSALAYGSNSSSVIPPHAVLIYEVELLEVFPNGQ